MKSNFQWNHNNHYHNLLLHFVPFPCSRAIDIGCGYGQFTSILSRYCDFVEGIDIDKEAILKAQKAYRSILNLSFTTKNLIDGTFDNVKYDFISAISSIHHMDFTKSIIRIKEIMNPGARLAVLGLYKNETMIDYLYTILAVPINFIYKLIKGLLINNEIEKMITTNPKNTFKEIKILSEKLLPGSKLRRHLFWRYSLIWDNN